MTDAEITRLVASNPVHNLFNRLGEITVATLSAVATLEDRLRELDQVTQDLAGHHQHVVTDLTPVGNAARHARTAVLADDTAPAFHMPVAS